MEASHGTQFSVRIFFPSIEMTRNLRETFHRSAREWRTPSKESEHLDDAMDCAVLLEGVAIVMCTMGKYEHNIRHMVCQMHAAILKRALSRYQCCS